MRRGVDGRWRDEGGLTPKRHRLFSFNARFFKCPKFDVQLNRYLVLFNSLYWYLLLLRCVIIWIIVSDKESFLVLMYKKNTHIIIITLVAYCV